MVLRNLINRFRLSSTVRRGEPELFLCSLLGYRPDNLTLYQQALTHRSAARKRNNNERLEFLGDAVIGLAVADELYRLYPDSPEGVLTRYRSRLVCRERLNCIAHRIGVAEHLRKDTSLRKNAEDVYGNALEALVGAIYKESGYERAEAFVRKYIVGNETALRHELEDKEDDYKTILLEWGQHHRQQVVFKLLKEQYDAATDVHTFVVQVEVGDKSVQGGGYTKRAAQHTAARKMLAMLEKSENARPL